ncbi:hypothetical protein [Desulfogranum marinum]|uniref:hypothetical protein n=1 Tax=Desulfogranum marinum TaxID=453220 RepID=UPI0029C6C3B1|nr:hypothetical protein [Desulfogranum marinum]
MGKFNKHRVDNYRFGKCEICRQDIPIDYYFSKGDLIMCSECGTEYILTSKSPVKLSIAEGSYGPDDYYGDLMFEEY